MYNVFIIRDNGESALLCSNCTGPIALAVELRCESLGYMAWREEVAA